MPRYSCHIKTIKINSRRRANYSNIRNSGQNTSIIDFNVKLQYNKSQILLYTILVLSSVATNKS